MKTELWLPLLLVLCLPAAAQHLPDPVGDPVIEDPTDPEVPTGTTTTGPVDGLVVDTLDGTSLRLRWTDAMSRFGAPYPAYDVRLLKQTDITNPDDPSSAANNIDNAQWTADADIVPNVPVPQGDGDVISLTFEDLDLDMTYVFRVTASAQESTSSDQRRGLAQGMTYVIAPPSPKSVTDAGAQGCGGSAAGNAGLMVLVCAALAARRVV